MTGPEHYRTAETDLEAADECFESNPAQAHLNYQSAQVHATLALAAATAMAEGNGMDNRDWAEWAETASVARPRKDES